MPQSLTHAQTCMPRCLPIFNTTTLLSLSSLNPRRVPPLPSLMHTIVPPPTCDSYPPTFSHSLLHNLLFFLFVLFTTIPFRSPPCAQLQWFPPPQPSNPTSFFLSFESLPHIVCTLRPRPPPTQRLHQTPTTRNTICKECYRQ